MTDAAQALLNLVPQPPRRPALRPRREGGFCSKVNWFAAEDGGSQRIQILDNGLGIENDALSKLFRPFYTTKADGTGLGLAVVQKIIVQHGGQ